MWKSFFRVKGKGIEGNMKGEGRLLGGLFVVGAASQGVLLEHREKEFGDIVSLEAVKDAVQKIQPVQSNS